jgi:hypothetical protein
LTVAVADGGVAVGEGGCGGGGVAGKDAVSTPSETFELFIVPSPSSLNQQQADGILGPFFFLNLFGLTPSWLTLVSTAF